MNGLTLHCGASHVDLKAVRDVPTPRPEGTHYPIPHALLYEEVRKGLNDAGLRVYNEAHALTHDGARYFGLIELTSDQNDRGIVVGLRNTHDKSWSAALACGDRVFVCDNLSFSGEVLLGRKHTKHILEDLPLLVPRAIETLGYERVCLEKRVEAYKQFSMDCLAGLRADRWILHACVRRQIFPPSMIPRVVDEWEKPAHEEFEPRTAWSLFNAFTEAAKPNGKRANPATLANRTRRLHGMFTELCGLTLPTREEILTRGSDDFVTVNEAFSRN